MSPGFYPAFGHKNNLRYKNIKINPSTLNNKKSS
jgi:hypothetical protein